MIVQTQILTISINNIPTTNVMVEALAKEAIAEIAIATVATIAATFIVQSTVDCCIKENETTPTITILTEYTQEGGATIDTVKANNGLANTIYITRKATG